MCVRDFTDGVTITATEIAMVSGSPAFSDIWRPHMLTMSISWPRLWMLVYRYRPVHPWQAFDQRGRPGH